jgi:UDP-N-acetylmuramate: L-alanyl-gamma-D-glutamyl-meso-diaminopimelate ligase
MKHVHILGACGTFMGGVAAIASKSGFRVTGADRSIYPPMSDQLKVLGIELIEGYAAGQLQPRPDMVVVGNVMSRGMPVVEEMLNLGIPYMSGPEWLAMHALRDRWVIAVSGTHGKTTTTSLLAWIFQATGRDAGYLIGGAPVDFDFSARLGSDTVFVIEADEYDTAFFDKRAKFLHYRPRTLIINNLEFDHADIYPDLAAITRQFHQLVRAVPGNGLIVAPGKDLNVSKLLEIGCWTPVEKFTSNDVASQGWSATEPEPGVLSVARDGVEIGRCNWQLAGAHNCENALAALLAARHAGVDVAPAMRAIGTFRGVRRRMQRLGEFHGVTLYDDFAHHPTAIRRSIDALRGRVGAGRIVAIFEPRSNSMKLGAYVDTLAAALSAADIAYVFRPPGLAWSLDDALRGAKCARVRDDTREIVAEVVADSRPGDAVVIMSNGDFEGISSALRDAFATMGRAQPT